MSLKQRIDADLKQALLSGDRKTTDTLRGLKAAILDQEVSKGTRDIGLPDQDIETLIQREVKKRRESIELYQSNNRPELAESEQSEITILEVYLPKQLTEDELNSIIQEIISNSSDASLGSMGKIIGEVKAKVGSSADGATIARLVKANLS